MYTLASIPAWKKVLFGLFTVIAFFMVTELALNLIGVKPLFITEDPFLSFAGNIPLFVEQTDPDGTVSLVTNKAKVPLFNEDQRFPRIKGRNTFRVFCMGSSTTYGHPFFDSTSFCGWLREFLPAADPSRKWEVINAGGVSYASYRVANLMNELSQYGPDLFVIYSGQNEFLEERTYRNLINTPYWAVALRVALSRTRTFTAMNRLLVPEGIDKSKQSSKRHTMSSEENAILNNSLGPASYKRDDMLKDRIIEHYRLNLRRMVAVSKAAGSRIIFVTPASILKDMPPFKSENRSGMTASEKASWSSLYEQGRKFQEAGKSTEALKSFNAALKIDDRYSDLHFRTGQVLFDLRDYRRSKVSFQRAIDEDVCPLRILSPMSRALHAVADESGSPLVDFVRLIEEDCYRQYGHDIPGDEYFLDHIHPTIEGHRRLGLALVELLIKQGAVRPGPSWNDATIARVTKKVGETIGPDLRTLAFRNLALTTAWTGRHAKAHSILLQALPGVKDGRNKGLIYDTLAALSENAGQISAAIDYWYKALPYWPDNKTIRVSLAFCLQKTGRLKEALVQHREVLRIIDSRQKGHIPGSAELDLYDPVSIDDHVAAHSNMAGIFHAQGRKEESAFHFAEAKKALAEAAAGHP